MIKNDRVYVEALKRILHKVNYIFILKNIRGKSDFIDPWYNYEAMSQIIDKINIPYPNTIKMLYLGETVKLQDVIDEIGDTEVNTLIDSMLLVKEGKCIHTCNLVVLLYQGLYILTEINPWYETCRHINTDVYIGMDSLRLAENIVFKKGSIALDLCSGTGIQGMLAAKS